MVGQTISHYRILKLLGKGAMGVVYLAEDIRLKRPLALKVLSCDLRGQPESLRRFRIEAEAVARLNHPNIATLYTVEEVDGQFLIALEYVEGESLKDLIPETGLDLEVFFDWFLPLSEALAHAHERGITHRDIKPANIMVTKGGEPKILDFGLARIQGKDCDQAEGGSGEESLTQIGTIMGTPAYMSPEQAVGKRVDHRTDIFSFGILMYEAITGGRPFKGQTVQEIITSILKDQQDAVSSLKPGIPYLLNHIVAKALQKDLRKRYQTVHDMVNDLRVAKAEWEDQEVSGESALEKHVAKSLPGKTDWSKWRMLMASGACLLLLGALCGWLLVNQKTVTTEQIRRVYRIPMGGEASPITGGGPSISPDGRMIAYVQDERLWILDLGTGQSMQVHDAVQVEQQPFWSPDSLNVGYLTDMGRTIRKALVKSGQSATICNISSLGYASSASWGNQGDIVFDLWGSDWTRGLGLLRVPQDGGDPQPLLQFDPLKGEAYQAPYYLPNGEALLWVTVHADGSSELVVRSGGVSRSLVKCPRERIFYPVYCSSGYLIYQKGLANEYGIWAVPFSLLRLETTGDPFLIAQSGAWPSVSLDGTLTYMSEPLGKQQLVWLNRKGEVLSGIGPSLTGTQIGGVALSPQQTRVAIDAFEKSYEDIWIIDIERGTDTRLTYTLSRDAEAAWSPDGARIAFSSERDGMSDLFLQPLDGGARPEVLVKGRADKSNPHWSRDGRFLVYEMLGTKTNRDIWYLPTMPKGAQTAETWVQEPVLFLQTPFDEAVPQISPDSRYLAYMSNVSGRWEVYARPFPDGVGEWQVSVRGGAYPRWSSHGEELFFVEGETLMAAKVFYKPNFRVDVPQKLFQWNHLGLYFTRRYDISADGQRFVAVQETSEGKRYLNVIENWHKAYASH